MSRIFMRLPQKNHEIGQIFMRFFMRFYAKFIRFFKCVPEGVYYYIDIKLSPYMFILYKLFIDRSNFNFDQVLFEI